MAIGKANEATVIRKINRAIKSLKHLQRKTAKEVHDAKGDFFGLKISKGQLKAENLLEQAKEALKSKKRQKKKRKKRRPKRQHVPLRFPCHNCGALSATVGYYPGTNVVQTLTCDGCGMDLR